MLRKALVVLLVMVLTCSVFAADIVPVKRAKGPVAPLSELDEITWLLQTIDSESDYYLGSGDQDDTMLTVFTPLAPCSLYYVEQQWYIAGNYAGFLWYYDSDCQAEYPFGQAPARGSTALTPVGDLIIGPYETSTEASQEWESVLPEAFEGHVFGDPEAGTVEYFCGGWVKRDQGGTPNPLADDISARGTSWTWLGGPWNDAETPWGGYSPTVIDLMMRAGVSYPWGQPPLITGLTSLPNTVNAAKTCMVTANIEDDVAWSGDHSAMLKVKVNDGEAMEYTMTDDDEDGVFEASFTLDAMVGDMVYYWVVASDNDGLVNDQEPLASSFEIVEFMNPAANLLIVDDGIREVGVLDDWLMNATDLNYEVWTVADNKGMDNYTLDMLPNLHTVMVIGWGVTTVPTRGWEDVAYYNYLMGDEANFVLIDQDYFYANGEGEEVTFGAGDFAYDVLGIESGLNDAAEPAADSTFYGEDHGVSDMWMDAVYTIFPERISSGSLWTDIMSPNANAEGIFLGENNGETCGLVMEDGGLTSVCLSFQADFAADSSEGVFYATEDFENLMNCILAFFEYGDVEDDQINVPAEYSLTQNYPNPFNPSTQISFSVPTTQNVALKVFNVAGQEVASLHNGSATAGKHIVNFDASNLSSGIYFYRIEAGSFVQTRKMMLVK